MAAAQETGSDTDAAESIDVDMANVHGERNVLVVGLVVLVLTIPRHFVVFAVPRRLGALRVPRTRMVPASSVMGSRREECRSRDQRMRWKVYISAYPDILSADIS